MKKLVALLLSMVMIFAVTNVFAQDVNVIVLDEKVEFDRAPLVEDDTLYIPLRFVAEKLGATVAWDGDTQSVFVSVDGILSSLQIGNDKIFSNGTEYAPAKVPVLVENRTLVTSDVIERMLGVKCAWDKEAGIATVNK